MFYDILSSLALQIYAKVKLRPNRLFYSTCGPLNDVTNHKRKFSTKKVLSPRKQKNGINYNYCKIFITKDIPTNDKQATIYYLYLKTSSMIVQI